MDDVSWVQVATTDSVPLREGRAVALDGCDLALFNLGDEFLATDNRCPHQGGPLCDGIVSGRTVVCPLHAWKIDLTSGRVVRPAAQSDGCVRTYPTRVVDGIVEIALPAAQDRVAADGSPDGAPDGDPDDAQDGAQDDGTPVGLAGASGSDFSRPHQRS